MTHFATRDCQCSVTTGTGQKRPELCEHGHRFETAAERSRPRGRGLRAVSEKRAGEEAAGTMTRSRSTLKQGRGFKASPEQQAKVKGLVCVLCHVDFYEAEIEPAHVYPRRLATCTCADGVVPLCSPCHALYDDQNQSLDLMPALIEGGYRKEIVHAFVDHQAPMGEVLRIITGAEWKPAELGAAA